jgi:CRP-like cAMP-binding protein
LNWELLATQAKPNANQMHFFVTYLEHQARSLAIPLYATSSMEQDKLLAYFNSFLPINQEEISLLGEVSRQRKIKRKQFLLSEGEVCKHYNFIIEGCFKMYKVDSAGKEHNLHFACENQWLTDVGSFHSDAPSSLFIEAIEPSNVIQIKKEDLLRLYEQSLNFNRIFRVIVENQFVELQMRLLDTISTTAQERYQTFMEQYPHLLQRLPNTQIASYIGITPEFLSRIRKEMATS